MFAAIAGFLPDAERMADVTVDSSHSKAFLFSSLQLFPLITYSFVFMGIIYVCANFIQGFQTYLNMSISLVVSGVGAMAYGKLSVFVAQFIILMKSPS